MQMLTWHVALYFVDPTTVSKSNAFDGMVWVGETEIGRLKTTAIVATERKLFIKLKLFHLLTLILISNRYKDKERCCRRVHLIGLAVKPGSNAAMEGISGNSLIWSIRVSDFSLSPAGQPSSSTCAARKPSRSGFLPVDTNSLVPFSGRCPAWKWATCCAASPNALHRHPPGRRLRGKDSPCSTLVAGPHECCRR